MGLDFLKRLESRIDKLLRIDNKKAEIEYIWVGRGEDPFKKDK